MELSKFRGRNAAFPVQAIDILTHDKLQMVPLHQLNECHVRLRWICLLDWGNPSRRLAGGLSGLWFTGSSPSSASRWWSLLSHSLWLRFFILFLIRLRLPASRACLKNCIEAASIVGDPAGRWNASTSEGYEMLWVEDHLSKSVYFLLEYCRFVEVLLLLFLGSKSSVCHCFRLVWLFLVISFRLWQS